jgi:hypothetical protein
VLQVRQGAEIFWFEPHLVQVLAVEGDQMIDPFHHSLEPTKLHGFKLFPRQRFVILVTDHGTSDPNMIITCEHYHGWAAQVNEIVGDLVIRRSKKNRDRRK